MLQKEAMRLLFVTVQDEWTQTLNTGRRRRDEKTGNLFIQREIATSQARPAVIGQAGVRQQIGSRTGEGSATGGQSDRRWVGNRRAVRQAMGRQQAGSWTGDGSATGGQSYRRWVGNRRAVGQAMGRQQAGRRWVGNRRAVGQAMGRQQAGSRTGDGSATGLGNRRGSQAGRVWQQTGNWITGQRLGKQEHELVPAGRRSPA